MYMEQFYRGLLSFKMSKKCVSCDTLIEEGTLIKLKGGRVCHPNCFICAYCRKPLQKSYVTFQSYYLCSLEVKKFPSCRYNPASVEMRQKIILKNCPKI